MKTCNECGEELPLTDFHVCRRSADGRHTRCRACRSQSGIRYDGRERKANRDFSVLMAAIPAFNFGALRWTW